MKLISFNVNGIRAAAKKGLLDSIQELNPDIMGFQETKATEEQVREVLFGLDYYIYAYSAEKLGYSGTAVISKKEALSVQYGIGIPEHDDQGRAITCEFEDFYLLNVYVPNSGNGLVRLPYRKTWDEALLNYIKELEKKKPVVYCGDMNVAHREIDIKNAASNYNKTAGYTQDEIDGMDNYVNAGLVDTFRSLHPETIKYSWWSYRMNARARNIGWRIDYFLVSERLASRVKEAFILNEVEGSDHCPVGIVLE
ncbi:MAG: exodeoxyribonuclease III [Flavobacteriales bacterium]|nr:exodeoxyribonuclease III [Flavobacteriales bacterium]MCB9204266.1 exodeoxyribonuclease III [Flavobacteriales bacterium]